MKKIGMSLLVVALSVVGFAKVSRAADEKITGYVIDEKCSANAKMMGNAECAKKCADGGSKLVIATDKGGKVYAVDNQDQLKGHEGHHVTVTGEVTGKSIHVTDVAMTPTN